MREMVSALLQLGQTVEEVSHGFGSFKKSLHVQSNGILTVLAGTTPSPLKMLRAEMVTSLKEGLSSSLSPSITDD